MDQFTCSLLGIKICVVVSSSHSLDVGYIALMYLLLTIAFYSQALPVQSYVL